MPTNGDDLDEVRRRLIDAVDTAGTTLAALSRALGRNHAYLHQFVFRGSPRVLSAEIRQDLGRILGVDPALLAGDDAASVRRQRMRRAGPPPTGITLTAFARRLTIARLESGFDTPAAFCAAAGLDRSRFADLEDGIDDPTMEELDRIAAASGKTFDWLIRGPRRSENGGAQEVRDPAVAADHGRNRSDENAASSRAGGEETDGRLDSCYPDDEESLQDHFYGGKDPNRRVR